MNGTDRIYVPEWIGGNASGTLRRGIALEQGRVAVRRFVQRDGEHHRQHDDGQGGRRRHPCVQILQTMARSR
jgi:hypothetical protein